MRATVKELDKSTDGVRFYIEIRGELPSGAPVRERRVRTFPDKKTADGWARARIFALIRGESEGPAAPKLSALWEDYKKKHVEGQRLKPSQKTSLQSLWKNHLEPCFGKLRIDQIDYDAVQSFKTSRSSKSPKTVNNALIALKAVLNFAHKKTKQLATMPEIELLKVPKTLPKRYDIPTYNKLVAGALSLSDRHAAVVLLGGDAGLRAGEMAALEVADLALPMLSVNRNLWRGHIVTAKGNAQRALPLTRRAVEVLARLATSPGPVLRSRRGTRLNQTQLERLLRQAAGAAGVPYLSLHKLRHTFGTDVTKALGIRAAQALLGHADVKTTERYAHAEADPELAEALERRRLGNGGKKP